MKLLKEVYKTYEGARKRAGFENGIAKSEYEKGYKAKHYHYSVVPEGNGFRVQRTVRKMEVQS
jgi:hypothetical protein